ncbi:SOCS box domain-containing protein [Trichonephila clavata]|uniref:SOCS box domain-containing protein n=1 Tax=Trichonephila clavata TaxID=2740835 RepID=A0A8X6L9Q6_TRICU|nr:SOCS box domain-containing protein [Trichonephila clavata]
MDDTYIDILGKYYVARDCSRSIYLADYLKILPKNFPFVEKYLLENSRELFLLKFIRLSLRKSPQKCKMVSNMLNRLKNIFHEHHDRIFYVLMYDVLEILVPLYNDSNIVSDLLFAFNFEWENILIEDRTNIKFYLENALASKQKSFKVHHSGNSFVDICIKRSLLQLIKTALCFTNPSRWSERHHRHNYRVVTDILCSFNNELLRPLDLGMLSKERFYLLIQLVKIYLYCQRPSTSKSVRLIWSSIPDCLFSFNELNQYYGTIIDSEVLRNIFEFYSAAVGSESAYCQPRSLKHLSKCTVRSVMEVNGRLCPQNIEKLFVPIEVRAYLKLEE